MQTQALDIQLPNGHNLNTNHTMKPANMALCRSRFKFHIRQVTGLPCSNPILLYMYIRGLMQQYAGAMNAASSGT
jgi:hypothetical protein